MLARPGSRVIEFLRCTFDLRQCSKRSKRDSVLCEGGVMNSTRVDSIGFYVAVALVSLTFLVVLAVIANPIIRVLAAI